MTDTASTTEEFVPSGSEQHRWLIFEAAGADGEPVGLDDVEAQLHEAGVFISDSRYVGPNAQEVGEAIGREGEFVVVRAEDMNRVAITATVRYIEREEENHDDGD